MAFDTVSTPSGRAEHVLGGSANYFSVAASFYHPVRVVAVVGRDFPNDHLKILSKRKVDVSGVEVASGDTFRWVGEYEGDMNEARTLSTQLNVFEHFSPKLGETHRKCSYVFLGNIDPTLQGQVLDQVSKPRIVAADTMNFWITGKPKELKETLSRIDLLSINEAEAKLLSGESNLVNAARGVQKLGPKAVVIKRGEYGASLFVGNEVFMAPAFPTGNVVDPTGAGDSFAGAMMGTLAAHGVTSTSGKAWTHALRQSIVNGCVMASFTIEDFSLNRILKLKTQELKSRQKKFADMIKVR